MSDDREWGGGGFDGPIAFRALDHSKTNQAKIEAHEELCAERYQNIHSAIQEIKAALKWAGGTGFMVIVGVMGWSITQQVNANDAAKIAAETKIELLQKQIQETESRRQVREDVDFPRDRQPQTQPTR